jgi:hypothetical protein
VTIPVELADGRRLEFPDGTDQAVIQQTVRRLMLPKPTARQQIQASAPMRAVQGMRDPIDAGAQLLPKGLEAVTGLFGLAPNRVSDFFGSEAQRVTDMNNAAEGEYQAARQATGSEGFDAARFTGNIASPANLAIASAVPIRGAMTAGQLAGRGAMAGAAGGALQPVEDLDGFWGKKALQTGTGAAAGAVVTPAAGMLGKKLASYTPKRSPAEMLSREEVVAALRKEGIDPSKVDESMLQAMWEEAKKAAAGGKDIDPVAAIRRGEFNKLQIDPTLGQITRDPTQFAKERNLRGIEGAGEPLMVRFNEQNRMLAELLNKHSQGAKTPYEAGNMATQRLTNVDRGIKARVDALYQGARDSTGRASGVNVKAFSEAANNALDEGMLGAQLPANIRTLLNDVSSGKIPLNVNTMVQMDSVLSAAQRSAQGSEKMAIGVLRDALNKAPIEDAAGEGAKRAFDTARTAARGRFKLQEVVPALADAVEGKIAPEKFVDKYVIGGSVDNVRRLAKVLDPGNRQQVAAQVGEYLQTQAFGANPAGDALFTPARFQKALEALGPEKLRIVFGKEAADELARIGRVGGYINSVPGPAAVNHSNTAAALTNVLSKIPGFRAIGSGAQAVGNTVVAPISRSRQVAAALNAQIPQTPAQMTPESAAALARALSVAAPVAGTAAAPRF